MKLLKCHVENFGTLSDFSFSFDEKLTVINQKNGFGKTTLAAFLKAMFYGLPQTAKKDIEKDERKRVLPWQGGNFGGTLDFSHNGKIYRIERFFGAKPKDDEFVLYDLQSGSKSTDFTENIGLELFEIDAESFERSIYMPQRNVEVESTNSISAKLGNLVENSDDINNYDSAMDALKKRRLYYTVSNGARGIIAETTREISELDLKIEESKTAADALDEINHNLKELNSRVADLDGQLKSIRQNMTDAAALEVAQSNKKRKEELLEAINKNTAVLAQISAKYPNGFMSGQELEEVKQQLGNLNNVKAKIKFIEQNTADKQELETLNGFFKGDIPSEVEVLEQKEKLKQLELYRAKVNTVVAQPKGVEQKGHGKVLPLVLGIGAALLLAVGIGLLFVNEIIGISSISVGIVMALIAVIVYFKGLISSISNQGVAGTSVEDYDQAVRICKANEEQISLFVSRFVVTDDFACALDEISLKLRDYKRLEQSVLKQDEELKACRLKEENAKSVILQIFSKYCTVVNSFDEELQAVVDAKREFERIANILEEDKQKCAQIPEVNEEQLKKATGVNVGELQQKEAELQNKQDELREEISKLSVRASQLSIKADMLSDFDAQRDSKQEQRAEYKQSLEVIDKTMELLAQAHTNLSQRYTEPITQGFKKYSSVIEGSDVGEFMIDTELNLNVERYGKAKKKQQFSAGYKDMLDIAMRLALIDALYGDDKPMLILDDPFVNLDDERLGNALEMLKKLSENQQIVYLTCHSSRVI